MHTVSSAIPHGTIAAIPAKAHAHRALICAALASSPSTVCLSRTSKDIDATMDSLRALGARITYTDGIVSVVPGPAPSVGRIYPNESGTTLRLLLPVSASICNTVDVDAKGRLPERPLEPLLSEMKAHGVSFSQDRPPFTMTGHLQGGTYTMRGDVSSQFFSGLLLASPQSGGGTVISTTLLQSKDYVSLTARTMADFGVPVSHAEKSPSAAQSSSSYETYVVRGGTAFMGRHRYPVEGDWSNAAVWMVAAAMTGRPVTVTGMNRDSVQADRRITDIITSAGARIDWNHTDVTVSGRGTVPLHADLGQIPDLLPVLSALACSIPGESSFINGARLRLKESDRLESVAQLVRDLGGTVHLDGDDMYIIGSGHLKGGHGDCVNDHRLVMAGALMALISDDPVVLRDSEAVGKSYPDFFNDWNLLGGNAHVI